MENDDLEIDDVFAEANKKKKIKSGKKGKSAERDIVHLLNERFDKILRSDRKLGEFSRSVGSGNRWGQKVILSETSKQIYAGDITCPDTFLWVIESKKGYNDTDIFSCFGGKCQQLDEFLQQVSDDAHRTGRKPLLIWMKDRKERVAFVKISDSPYYAYDLISIKCPMLLYHGWMAFPFAKLLEAADSYFFKDEQLEVLRDRGADPPTPGDKKGQETG